jgi:hypothetical protein
MKRVSVPVCCLAFFMTGPARSTDEKVAVDPSKLPPSAAGKIDFERDIQPIFARACLKCHGSARQKGGLRLDGREAALQGGNSGAVIKPGDARQSRLLHLITGLDPELKMPPTGPSLTTDQVGKIRAWIEQGANRPKTSGSAPVGNLRSTHWAFVPPEHGSLPCVSNHAWVRNGIDAFVLARLEKEKISPAPEADRATLARRLYLDLLGLPPEPGEVEAFEHNPRSDAYEQLVDRLLASPHYGERWGRHWLDVARYADSDGFEKDTGRPHAWRYRDWVIDALNHDLPFDEFTIEQLAGDLLPHATVQQRIATGFHRNTLTNKEGGVDQEQFRVEQVVDRVNTTAKVFLGATLGCAQCHDHKYDPYTQREYYQLLAFFNSDREVDLPVPQPGELDRYKRARAVFDQKLKALKAEKESYQKLELPVKQQQWEQTLALPMLRKLPADIRAVLVIEPNRRDPEQKKTLAGYYAGVDQRLADLTKAVAAHQKTAPLLSQAQTLALGPARPTHVLIRGDFLRPGVEVTAGTPAILPPLPRSKRPTRLDLARWLVTPDHPLTSRVFVNWVWHHYFGRGIVPTPEDFGTQGERPSHPELLDWLATEFVRQNCGMKALHKLIVMSATYRQSSAARPELLSRDPLNVLLARQNRPRLEAEIVRDMALTASGLLHRRIGGPSVRPPQPQGISELTYADSVRWVESAGPDRYRRGMYTWFQRTSPYPMLMTFDAPDSNVCCVRRERSDTPLQALTLLNDTAFVEAAQALAQRILRERPTAQTPGRIDYAFRICLGRGPTSQELSVLVRVFQDFLKACQANPDNAAKLVGSLELAKASPLEAAWVALARTIMNLDEFVTRE